MNKLSGYHIGIFVSDMDRAEETGDMLAIVKAARKLHPNAREIEKEIFDSVKEDENGKASTGATEETAALHVPGHKTMSMRLIPD